MKPILGLKFHDQPPLSLRGYKQVLFKPCRKLKPAETTTVTIQSMSLKRRIFFFFFF